jgi:hypothetical protein
MTLLRRNGLRYVRGLRGPHAIEEGIDVRQADCYQRNTAAIAGPLKVRLSILFPDFMS